MRERYLQYFQPLIDEQDIEAVSNTLRYGWLTSGPKVKEFEECVSAASGIKHAIAVNSCTSALHLALIAAGVGPGDEVVMPSLTFVAGAECVLQLGAQPIFCDVEADTLCASRRTVETVVGSKTKAIIPMHYGGQPADIAELAAFARPRGIRIIEDAAHAMGTISGGHWPGWYSDGAAYSFYATKNITSGEGGMLLTNNDEMAHAVRILALHGIDRDAWHRHKKGAWEYDVVRVGYKYNMPDTAAALGLSQFAKLGTFQAQRSELATLYTRALREIMGMRPVAKAIDLPDRHSWCVYAIEVNEDLIGVSRDVIAKNLHQRNIGTSVHFIPTHLMSAYMSQKHPEMPTTNRVWQRLLSLPLYPSMTSADVTDVISALKEIGNGALQSQKRRAVPISLPRD
jgi:dTDP-4-amino-4,6-dideoxygalactose transaminase